VKVVERSTPTILLPIDLCDGARRTKSTPLLSTGRACSRCGRLSRGSSSHRRICWSTRNVSKRQQFRSRRLSRETPNLPASLPPPFSQGFRGTHWCERSMNVIPATVLPITRVILCVPTTSLCPGLAPAQPIEGRSDLCVRCRVCRRCRLGRRPRNESERTERARL